MFYFLDVDLDAQKKKEEEKAREKELNDLFKVAVSQPKVPVGMVFSLCHCSSGCYPHYESFVSVTVCCLCEFMIVWKLLM
jgi:hypothetical protein